MTANQRIFWNFVATYGRSVYTLIIGLICGRWTLMAMWQWMVIMMSEYLDPVKNAAMNVAGKVSGNCNNVAGSFLTALMPVAPILYEALTWAGCEEFVSNISRGKLLSVSL